MLVEFSVQNYRSFKERVTLSMVAAKLRSSDKQLDTDNVIEVNNKLALLRSGLIYGANASGKSNLVQALHFMRDFVANSAREGQATDMIPVKPFSLNTSTIDQPSAFEVVFLLDGVQYRYGFAATSQKVTEEWLYFVPTRVEVELFTRDTDGIYVKDRFRECRGLEEMTRDNALFLSVSAQFNKPVAKRLLQWFTMNCRALNTIGDEGYLPFTISCIAKGRYKKQIVELVRRLDLGIRDISVIEEPIKEKKDAKSSNLGKERVSPGADISISSNMDTQLEFVTYHAQRDNEGNIVREIPFFGHLMESEGTRKVIALLVPILDVLTNGWTLFIDEIDTRMHPLITSEIIRLFNSPETNPKNAQLICVTHDTNLLDRRRFRRDQIYFMEKDGNEATRLYSLAEFKLPSIKGKGRSIRNDASYEKDYIQGRYGAIPYLGDLGRLFLEEFNKNNRRSEGQDNAEAIS